MITGTVELLYLISKVKEVALMMYLIRIHDLESEEIIEWWSKSLRTAARKWAGLKRYFGTRIRFTVESMSKEDVHAYIERWY